MPVNEEMFARYPEWHGNKMAYARLMLPDALPDVDWCVYCDVDFLWLRDVAELWKEKEEGITLVGTMDGARVTLDEESRWFADNGYAFDPERYFCSGLCFMNLKVFRRRRLTDSVMELLEKHQDFLHPDQNALNIATYGSTKLVSKCWQQFHQDVTPAMVKEGVVIHYAGAIPWKPSPLKIGLLSDLTLIWHRMNAQARGISLWKSLRMHFSTRYILWHRGLRNIFAVLNGIHCLGWLRWLLCKTGHGGVWQYWERASESLV